jgi:hypothetical protein
MYMYNVYNTSGQMPNTDPAIDEMRRRHKKLCTYRLVHGSRRGMCITVIHFCLVHVSRQTAVCTSHRPRMHITSTAGCTSHSPQDAHHRGHGPNSDRRTLSRSGCFAGLVAVLPRRRTLSRSCRRMHITAAIVPSRRFQKLTRLVHLAIAMLPSQLIQLSRHLTGVEAGNQS